MRLLPGFLDGFCIGLRERGVGGGFVGWTEGGRKVSRGNISRGNLGVRISLRGGSREQHGVRVSRRDVCKSGTESGRPDCLSESLIPGLEVPNPIFLSNFHHSLGINSLKTINPARPMSLDPSKNTHRTKLDRPPVSHDVFKSQRDFVLQPMVGRHGLPWETVSPFHEPQRGSVP